MKTSIFKKVYSGKIKRAISEGQLVPSETPEFYIEKEQKQIVEETSNANLYPVKIYNITEKSNYVEVTTNTLNLQFTDIFLEEEALYFKVKNLPKEAIPLGTPYLVEGIYTYMNIDVPYIQYGSTFYVVEKVFNVEAWAADPKVKIRRLKDRFKITFRTKSKFSVNLPSKSLFTPHIYNNWLKLYDCYFLDSSSKTSLLSSHTYEIYEREELHYEGDNIQLRDIPVSDIKTEKVGNFLKVSYTVYKSNLYSDTSLGNHLYYSLTFLDETYSLQKDLSDFKGIPLFKIINSDTQINTFYQNPYTFSPVYKILPESLYLIWDKAGKYSEDKNIPLGVTKFTISLKKYLGKLVKNFKGSKDIYGMNLKEPKEYNAFVTIPYAGTTRLQKLKTIATTGVINEY